MAEWLDKYVLNVPRPGKGWQTISAMHALRRDARGATFRNPETGNPEPKGPTPSWLGTVGYLILAEQIGTAVYNTTGRRMDPGLLRAWEHFGDPAVDMDQRKALRSLRNAFAHDFGLVSRGREDRHGKATGRYLYHLTPREPDLVTLGPPWNLDWDADPVKDSTHVAVIDLADHVEAMVDAVVAEHQAGQVQTDLLGGEEELRARFLFQTTL